VAETALSHNRWLSLMGSTFAPLSNWVMGLPVTRWLLEKTLGLDRTPAVSACLSGAVSGRKARKFLAAQPVQ
jgi:hypothetical protein